MGLIDAYKAMKSIDEIVCSMSVCINSDYCHGMTAMKDAAIHAIENQPTVDAVPVRCKDCKWFQSGIDINGKPFTRCNRLVRTYGHTAPDWFCADGERR